MSWAVIARKDFQDARLSKALWALTGLFVLLSAGFTVLYATVPELSQDVGGLTTLGLLALLMGAVTLFISIAAIVVAAAAIAGERENGSSKLLLGFPHSRADVIFGKLIGRTAVMAVSIVAGLALTLVVILAFFPTFAPVDYGIFVVMTLVLALVYVGIMVAISATTGSKGRAMAFGLGAFVALEILADMIPTAALYVTNGFTLSGVSTLPAWVAFLNVITPTAAYTNALGWFLGDGSAATANLGATLAGPIPVYLTGQASLVVLGLWLVIPLVFGYRRFNAADL